jgi:hypothetical protein
MIYTSGKRKLLSSDILHRVYAAGAVRGDGRADAVVKTKDAVYVFEFTVDTAGTAEDALKQIDAKGYLVPHAADGRKLVKTLGWCLTRRRGRWGNGGLKRVCGQQIEAA